MILKDFKIKDNIYKLSFTKESDNNWYIDYPNWPFSHHNLMMVCGADDLCELLAYNNKANVIVTINNEKSNSFIKYKKSHSSLLGGATYKLITNNKNLPETIWLCPVTLTVFGHYPEFISIENDYDTIFPRNFKNLPVVKKDDISKFLVDGKECAYISLTLLCGADWEIILKSGEIIKSTRELQNDICKKIYLFKYERINLL